MTIRSQRFVRPLLAMAPLAMGLAIGTVAAPAAAAEPTGEQIAARRQLIEQAQAAQAGGDHTRALDLADRAGQISMSVSLRRFIAEEQMAVGQPAAALGSAELCVREAKVEASEAHRIACQAIVDKARPLVAYLVITIRPEVASPVVTVDGKAVPLALLGQRYVVNPSEVKIVATAPGFGKVEHGVKATPGEVSTVELKLPPLPFVPARKAPPPPPQQGFYLSPLLPIGASVAVTSGVVALGVGLSGVVDVADYEDRCTVPSAPASCRAEQEELQSDLDTRAIVVDVALGLAAAGLVAGTIGIFLTGPTDEQKAALWQGKVLF